MDFRSRNQTVKFFHCRCREIDRATESKSFLEERQRQEARERSARSETWRPRFFIPAGDTWIFSEPLEQRLIQNRGGQQ